MKATRLLLALMAMAFAAPLLAQLDTIHWLPPMHARNEWGPQYLYLSTPEPELFTVNVRDGAGNLLTTAEISNAQPFRYDLGGPPTTPVLVIQSQLHKPVQGKGLVMDGPKKFYAYYRVHASSGFHAGDLTCKGRAALGTEFRIGHLVQEVDGMGRRSNFVGVMASEDDTEVTLSEFHPATDFQIGGVNTQSSGPVVMLLQKGETVVFSTYITASQNEQPPNGLMGALLKATKPVAVNCGSWVGAPVQFTAHDIGIDQIAPFEQVGNEYILCRGNGSSILERPIVIAHRDGTQVWFNGNTTPAANLNAGQYYIAPTAAYTADGNLYIRSSEPVFVYEMIGGTAQSDDAMRTAGLIFVPPISCGIPNAVDNIYQPNRIGSMRFEGGLMIVAMKDSLVTVKIDGTEVTMGAPAPVLGYPEFVTYRRLNLFSENSTPNLLSVVAEGAVQVAMFGRNQPASFAAFYSGFSKTTRPDIQITMMGDGVCPDTLVANGVFDGVQWMLKDSVLQYGADTFLVVYTPGQYTATGYLGVCRRTDFASDTILIDFNSPEFEYTVEEPSCFGFSDGHITFGAPYGGLPPYQFSIDNGRTFLPSSTFSGLSMGAYPLVARDVTGCYNRPLLAMMGQPDSFSVSLKVRLLPNPLKPGGKVELEALPGRPVVSAFWEPPNERLLCADCLTFAFHPEASTWVAVTVLDAEGCPAVDSMFIPVVSNVFAPNVIRPASSGGNDRFTLFTRDPVPIRRLAIFDRWGDLVFERRGIFTNDTSEGWDGSFKGKQALPGVYAFWAEVETLPGRVEVVTGDVTVLR
ncbi:MAG: gliding motility-associated C-terminal domain-containing protein [Saprospiraceae bacterium]|nr:gliding motility-associated C-terminal domain-containing protein [Saprospiraceae bacterium]